MADNLPFDQVLCDLIAASIARNDLRDRASAATAAAALRWRQFVPVLEEATSSDDPKMRKFANFILRRTVWDRG